MWMLRPMRGKTMKDDKKCMHSWETRGYFNWRQVLGKPFTMFGFVQQRQWNMGTDQEGIYWTSSMLRTCFFSFFFSSIMFPRVHLLGNIQYPLREKYEEEKEEGRDRISLRYLSNTLRKEGSLCGKFSIKSFYRSLDLVACDFYFYFYLFPCKGGVGLKSPSKIAFFHMHTWGVASWGRGVRKC